LAPFSCLFLLSFHYGCAMVITESQAIVSYHDDYGFILIYVALG